MSSISNIQKGLVGFAAVAALATASAGISSTAEAVNFKGKTIRVVIG